MRMRHNWMIVGTLLVTIVLAACGGSAETDTERADENATSAPTPAGQTVTITAEDMRFDPVEINVAAGTPIQLELVNAGTLEHDFTAPGLNHTDEIVEPSRDHGTGGGHSMGAMEPGTVHLAAHGGEHASVEFTPRAGTISFYCSVPGHKEAGMVGTIIVE
jgi:uncharacterized cupredoxin-like copper-binding protein